MCSLYSSSVVAPMHWKSPRARAGFSRLAASMEPSSLAVPDPISKCISSMNNRMFSSFVTSSITFWTRSSKSPRYLVSATSRPSCRHITRFPTRRFGTCPSTMRCARPSTIAVLPTPGSPTRQGLFFLRLTRIRIIRLSSSCLPIIGSSLPAMACAVRSTPHCSRVDFFFLLLMLAPAPTSATLRSRSSLSFGISTFILQSSSYAPQVSLASIVCTMILLVTGLLPFTEELAWFRISSASGANGGGPLGLASLFPPNTSPRPPRTPPCSCDRKSLLLTPALFRVSAVVSSFRRVTPRSRYSDDTLSTPALVASSMASFTAKTLESSNLSKSIRVRVRPVRRPALPSPLLDFAAGLGSCLPANRPREVVRGRPMR
mmetsp:Transcript_9390/g.34442  ORF Transcript_9390/g.34442 Transcript_9390/m.34442 type:complete len:374 (+) Transcript_9390:1564-2685(+)